MYGDEEGKRLYQEEVKKQVNDALKTIKSGEVLKSLSRSVPITDSAPTDNKIAQKPTETLTLRDPDHIENYDEESFLKGMYGDDEGAKIYKQQLATEKAETVTPPLQTAAVTMPKTSTIPSVAKLTDTTPAQSRVAVSDTTARAEAPLAPLAQVNYAVPPSTFLSTKNTTTPKTYAAAGVGKTATSSRPKVETAKATKLSEGNAMLDAYINKNYSGKKTVTIAIRRPVANSREVGKVENEKLDNGHAYIRLDDGCGHVEYIGYTPKDGGGVAENVFGAYVDGKYIDDKENDWNVAKTYVLTDGQYNSANNYIQKAKYANSKYDYHIAENNCVNFALNVLAHAGIAKGIMMPIKEHWWTLPDNTAEQMEKYKARPDFVPPMLASALAYTMKRYYGYTPSDAAQDLKSASGGVLLKYEGSNGIVHYNAGNRFTESWRK